MDREDWKDHLYAMAALIVPVVPVSLWQMESGSALERALAAAVLLLATWLLCFGVLRLLARRVLLGVALQALALLMLLGLSSAGVFEAVGF
jgi:hypothetical protein